MSLSSENEGNSWIGTNDAFFNTNGGGYGWAHGARFQGLGAVFNDPLPEERFYETDGVSCELRWLAWEQLNCSRMMRYCANCCAPCLFQRMHACCRVCCS